MSSVYVLKSDMECSFPVDAVINTRLIINVESAVLSCAIEEPLWPLLDPADVKICMLHSRASCTRILTRGLNRGSWRVYRWFEQTSAMFFHTYLQYFEAPSCITKRPSIYIYIVNIRSECFNNKKNLCISPPIEQGASTKGVLLRLIERLKKSDHI